MNIENIHSIFKQIQTLQKEGFEDTEKYRQLYDQLQQFSGDGNGWNQQQMNIEEQNTMLTEEQSGQLQNQILTYKMMTRNMMLPRDLEKQNLELSQAQWEVERERIFEKSVRKYHDKPEKHEELKKLISHFNQNKKPAPAQTPDGTQPPNQFEVDPKAEEYIERNSYFIERRKNDLSRLMGNGYLSDEARLRVTIEAKFLDSLAFYDKLKDSILRNVLRSKPKRTFEKSFLDRKFFTRERPSKKYEHKMMEKLENSMRNEKDQRKRNRNRDFLRDLHAHQAAFFEFHKRKQKTIKKRSIGFKAYMEMIEKREREAHDKQTTARVNALKQKDFDAYMDLVQKAKNTRIIELLRQTETFMRQLGAKVKVQRGEQPQDGVDEDVTEGQADENLAFNLKNSTKIYYDLTQSNKETIKEQPSLLEGGTLKTYQMAGLEWMVSLYNNHLNGILADEMGLGKTIQTISLFCYLMESKHNFGPFLIVVPLSTLPNWSLEFDKWAPSIKKIVYKGAPQARKQLSSQLKNTKWNVCLTTYEYILKDKYTLNKFNWQYIIIDEGHRMKNNKSKFAQTLGTEYNSQNRILLTGTPLQNNLTELWSLLNFLLPKVFNSADEFEKWFSLAVTNIASEKEAQLTEEEQLLIINRLHQVLRPFLLRRVKKEVEAEIPNKVEYVIKVELSPWQKIVYEQIKDRGVLTRDANGKIASKALMNLMVQLRKICDHPYLFLDPDYYIHNIDDNIFRTSGKFELLDRMLSKLLVAKHRILIFCQMTHVMDLLQIYFNYRGYIHLRLDGSTKADERGDRVAMFNKPGSEYDIFLLSTRAGGLGLNLQTADTVILFDSDWNPQMDLQAQDRAHRIGAKHEVRVLRFVTNTWIEEEILAKAGSKQDLDEVIIQAGMYNDRSTDVERREKLEDLLKKRATDSDSDDEIPDDEQLNELLARHEDEFKFYEQLDQERYEREKHIYPNFRHPQKGEGKFHNYRLITLDEVPGWVKEEIKVQEDEKEYGRGNRARKEVNYKHDMISDEQWIRAMENEEQGLTSDFSDRKKRRTRVQKFQSEDESTDQQPKRSLRKAVRNTRKIEEDLSEESGDDDDGEEQIYQDNDDDDDFDAPEDTENDKKKFKRMKKLKTDDESRDRSERGDGYTSTEY
jgi:ATP-dependent helicase STH1/SNF2